LTWLLRHEKKAPAAAGAFLLVHCWH